MDATDRHSAYNRAINQELHHEHDVIKSRMGWHNVIQLGMFTAFFGIVNQTFPAPLFLMKLIIPIVGIAFAASALFSLWVSKMARACILMHWNWYRTSNDIKWENYPPVTGDPFSHIKDCEEDEDKRIDMGLTSKDQKIAKHTPHWFMLYNFIPHVFIFLWVVCLINIMIVIVLTQKI